MDIDLSEATISLPAVDAAVLSQAARVDALIEVQRARAWVEATEQRLLASLVEPGDPPRGRKISAAVAAKQYVREGDRVCVAAVTDDGERQAAHRPCPDR